MTLPGTVLPLLVDRALVDAVVHVGPAALDDLLDRLLTLLSPAGLTTHVNQSILPPIEEVAMEAVSSGVIEGVVQLVPSLVDAARSEESLEEDSGQPLAVAVRTRPCCPARLGLHHVGVNQHVGTVQPAVPAGGERDLRPDQATLMTRRGQDRQIHLQTKF